MRKKNTQVITDSGEEISTERRVSKITERKQRFLIGSCGLLRRMVRTLWVNCDETSPEILTTERITMKPMLACEVPLEQLRFPMYASPKIDGIRCIIKDGVAYSRSLKPIRNRYIQSVIGRPEYSGLDGELIVGDNFQDCGAIMAYDGEPDFTYWVFDRWDVSDLPFQQRLAYLWDYSLGRHLQQLTQYLLHDKQMLDIYEQDCLETGYEGVILRNPHSPYKYGRSTAKEQYLVKRKPFVDDEAIITGFEEQYENTNQLGTNELGYAKRSGAQEGLVGKGTLGKFVVAHNSFGSFSVGTGRGLTQDLRQHIWDNRDLYEGRLIKFKYQPFGVKDKPRLPIFLGFRDEDDL